MLPAALLSSCSQLTVSSPAIRCTFEEVRSAHCICCCRGVNMHLGRVLPQRLWPTSAIVLIVLWTCVHGCAADSQWCAWCWQQLHCRAPLLGFVLQGGTASCRSCWRLSGWQACKVNVLIAFDHADVVELIAVSSARPAPLFSIPWSVVSASPLACLLVTGSWGKPPWRLGAA